MNDFSKQIDALSSEKRQLFDLMLKKKALGSTLAGPKSHFPAGKAISQPFCLITAEDRSKLPNDIEDAYPLSMVQLGMIYHMLQEGQSPSPITYHNVSSFQIDMAFNPEISQEAVNYIIARHPTLRTSFDLTTYSEPLQLVHKRAFLQIEVEDLCHLSPNKQSEAINLFIKQENFKLLDLSRPPLIRLFFHRISAKSMWFTLIEPHAISDGWSTHLTMVEMLNCYYALLNNEKISNADVLKTTYRDFIQLERATLRSEEHKQFWSRQLRELVLHRIPRWHNTKHLAFNVQDHKLYFNIPSDLLNGLKELARSAGVPLKSVLITACIKAVSIISGQSDGAIGLAFNGRLETVDGDQVRGLFLNTLPFRFKLLHGTWIDLIQQIYRHETEMLPFRRYPLAALQKNYKDQPLFEVVFQYLHFHSIEGSLQSSKLEKVGSTVDLSRANFPMMLSFYLAPVQPQRLILMLEYDVLQFHKEQIESFYGYIKNIMLSMSSDPLVYHNSQCFLSPAEQSQLLFEYNKTQTVYLWERGQCIHQQLEAQVDRSPDTVAVVFEDKQLTYAELDARANQLAHYLRSLGVGPEVLVGIAVERSLELLLGLLGILKAGGAYIPLDLASPPERLALILSDAQPSVLLTSQPSIAAPPPYVAQVVDLGTTWPLITHEPSTPLDACVTGDHLAYVIYTSGSTGIPKGVQVLHRAVANLLCAMRQDPGICPSDILCAVTTLAFDIAVLELFLPLTVGARVVLIPRDVVVDAPRLATSLTDYDTTIMQATPATWRMLLAVGWAGHPHLRVLCGGEALPSDLARRLLARNVEVWNMYGPTETTIWSTLGRVADQDAAPSLGRPIANTELYLLDSNGQLVPTGTPGELYIGGAGLARGYLRRPELTAERFLPHPFSTTPGARLYKTGDLVRYLPDSTLEFLGRLDHQVKVRGHRIELGEIEAILERHPLIREVVVLAREDTSGGKHLVAYFVPEPGAASISESEHETQELYDTLRRFLQQHLPGYMIPSTFVCLEVMPLTPNGKVNRSALPAPDAAARRANLTAVFTPPGTPVEQTLAAIWSSVLGVDRVGIHDNFFELGGDSILALQIVIRANQAGLHLTLNQLLRHQTIGKLAMLLSTSPVIQTKQEGITASDFPESQLSQSELDRILEKFGDDEEV